MVKGNVKKSIVLRRQSSQQLQWSLPVGQFGPVCYLEASCPWHPKLKRILCHNTQAVMRTYETRLGYNILSCLNMIACSQVKWHSPELSCWCDF